MEWTIENTLKFAEQNGLNVIPIKRGEKVPFVNWQEYQKRMSTPEERQQWFGDGKEPNIAFVCGAVSDNFCCVDFDSPELFQLFEIDNGVISKFHIVKTGGGGFHVYLKTKRPQKNSRIEFEKDGKIVGVDIKGEGGLAVAPPSIHPSSKQYQFLNDIKEIPRVDLDIHDWILKWAEAKKDSLAEWGLKLKTSSEKKVIDVGEILDGVPEGARNQTAIEYATFLRKRNYNPEETLTKLREWNTKNVPPLSEKELMSVVESAFKKDEPYAYKFQDTEMEIKPLPLIWEKDLHNIEIQPTKWLVQGLIPEKSIVFLAGKRGFYKSFGSLHIALCLASGLPVFNRFSTIKVGVLYIDEENGIELIKERCEKIKCGLEIINDVDVAFLSFENMKLDKSEWRDRLEKTLEEYKPSVIIVDSLRRVITFEENKAEDVNSFFTDILRPISEKYGVTWILVHHLRKGISGRNPSDELDEMRGSSDMSNYADVVLIFQRPKGAVDKFVLKQLKCRRSQEIEPKLIQMVWNEDQSLKIECVGDAEETIFADEFCAKAIMTWLAEEQKTGFETKEVIEALKKQKHSRKTISRALDLLLNQNKIIRIKRGQYQLKVENLEQFKGDKND